MSDSTQSARLFDDATPIDELDDDPPTLEPIELASVTVDSSDD
jgi:hypothetical protein